MDAADLRDALLTGAGTLGLELTVQQSDLLLDYLSLLQRWNGVYNLTAVRALDQMLVHHVFDSLSVISPLRRKLSGGGCNVIDVGSGGGLPGVVIAILNPDMEITCVDAVGKKAAFVQQVATELGLPNLCSKHARVEAIEGVRFDVVVSRAFASLADFASLTKRIIRDDGIWAAMKGKVPTTEIRELPADVDVFHVEQLGVPSADMHRCIVWMRPKQSL